MVIPIFRHRLPLCDFFVNKQLDLLKTKKGSVISLSKKLLLAFRVAASASSNALSLCRLPPIVHVLPTNKLYIMTP